MTKLKPWVHQNAFFQVPHVFPEIRYFMLVAGYGAGKTQTVAIVVLYLAALLQKKRDVAGNKPRVLIGGATISHFVTTGMVYILSALSQSGTEHTWDSKLNILTIGDVTFQVVSLSAPGTIKGSDVWCTILDEADDLGDGDTAQDLTLEAIKAMNERTRQRLVGMRSPFMMIATTSQGQKGLYRLYVQFKRVGEGYVYIRGRTQDNLAIDPSYYESLYRSYTETEREVYLEGKFLPVASGQVFPDYNEEKNYLHKDLDIIFRNTSEHLVWAQDFNNGYHRGCVMLEKNGTVLVLKDYEFVDIRIAPKVVRADFPKAKITWVPDATMKDQLTNYRKEVREAGINIAFRSKNPSVEDTVFFVNKLLYTRRLVFGKLARNTADDIARAMRGKNNEVPKGIGPMSPIHRCDTVRMGAFYLSQTRRTLFDIRAITPLGRHAMIIPDSSSNTIEELPGGFYEVGSDAWHGS